MTYSLRSLFCRVGAARCVKYFFRRNNGDETASRRKIYFTYLDATVGSQKRLRKLYVICGTIQRRFSAGVCFLESLNNSSDNGIISAPAAKLPTPCATSNHSPAIIHATMPSKLSPNIKACAGA